MHFAAPFVAALAALTTAVEGQRATCDRRQYAEVAGSILNPAFFCKWYLGIPRVNSPLKRYGSRSLTKLCRCFVQNSPRVRGPFRPLRPKAPSNSCLSSYYRTLRNQYADPDTFCRFFLKSDREVSPIPTMNNPATVKKSCRCWLNRDFPQQQPTTTTTRRTTTPVRTTTTTDDAEESTTTTTTTTTTPNVQTTTTSNIVNAGTTTASASTTSSAFNLLPPLFGTTTTVQSTTTQVSTTTTTTSTTTAPPTTSTIATTTSSRTTSSSSSSSSA